MSNIVASLEQAIQPIKKMFDNGQRPSDEAVYEELQVIAGNLDLDLRKHTLSARDRTRRIFWGDIRDAVGNIPVFMMISNGGSNTYKFGIMVAYSCMIFMEGPGSQKAGYPLAVPVKSIGAIITSGGQLPEVDYLTGEKALNLVGVLNTKKHIDISEISVYALYRK